MLWSFKIGRRARVVVKKRTHWHTLAMSNHTQERERGLFFYSALEKGVAHSDMAVLLFLSNCKIIRMTSINRSSSLKQYGRGGKERGRACVWVLHFSLSPCSMLFIHSGLWLWQNQIYRWACSFSVVTGDGMLHHCLAASCIRRRCSHVYPCSNPKIEASHNEL